MRPLEPVTNKPHSRNTPRPSLYGILKPSVILIFCFFWPSFAPLLCRTQVVLNFVLFFVFQFDMFLSGSSFPWRCPQHSLWGKSERKLGYETSVHMFNFLWRGHQSLFHFQTSFPTPWISWEEGVWENLAAYLYVSYGKSFFPDYCQPVFETPVVTFCG